MVGIGKLIRIIDKEVSDKKGNINMNWGYNFIIYILFI